MCLFVLIDWLIDINILWNEQNVYVALSRTYILDRSQIVNDLGDWVQSQVGSYQRLKMVLDTTLLNTQHYEVRIKGKVEQPRK